MSDTFSKRMGFRQDVAVQITVRNEAPREFRGVLAQLSYECGFRPETLRSLVCRVLRKRSGDDNWSEDPTIYDEVRQLLDTCDWYRVYDIVESIAAAMGEAKYIEKFTRELNLYFAERGIGWKLANATLEVRGDERSASCGEWGGWGGVWLRCQWQYDGARGGYALVRL